MKTLLVFGTQYENTAKIAEAIASALPAEVLLKNVDSMQTPDLSGIDLLVIGSPTQGGRPLKTIQAFLDSLSAVQLKGLKTAVFDTRVPAKWVNIFGFAAPKIASALKAKGAILITAEQAFFVKASKGPLLVDQLAKAAAWAKQLTTNTRM
jgi:flavodoxin